VAVGTLIHAVMWMTLTALGLAVLRSRRTSLADVDRAVGGTSDPDRQ
jgi:threonine/homoserine/homoserine lactone efflux protein